MTILKRISAYTLVSLITGGISFLILPVISKYLSPEDYGKLSIANSSIRFLGALISLGITHVLMVNIVKHRANFGNYFKSFLALSGTVTLILSFIILSVYLTSHSFFGIPFHIAIFLPILGFLITIYESFTAITVFLKDIKNYIILSLSKFGIELIGIFLFIVLLLWNWQGRLLALTISLVAGVVYGILYAKQKKLLTGKVSFVYGKELFHQGIPLISLNIAIMVINLSDRFFIDIMINEKATGLYSMGATIAGILLIIIKAMIYVFRPILYEKLNNIITHKNIKNITLKYVIILALSCGSIILLSPTLFNIAINESYQSSQTFVPVLVIGLFFWGMYSFYVSYLMYYKKSKLVSITTLLAIIVNLACNYLFIQQFHTIGAAYSTLLTYFILFLATYMEVKKVNTL